MFVEDLTIFFKDFGVESTTEFADATKENFTFLGIFEDPYAATQLGTYRVVISEPTLLCEETEDISGLRKNDKIIINTVIYVVLGSPKSDGTGVVRVELAEAVRQDDESSDLDEDAGGLYE